MQFIAPLADETTTILAPMRPGVAGLMVDPAVSEAGFHDPMMLGAAPPQSPLIPSDINTPTSNLFMPRLGGINDMVGVFNLLDFITRK
jgi:hypothetical protein